MRLIALFLATAALGGCATAAQQQAEQMKGTLTQGRTASNACWSEAAESQVGRELADLLPPAAGKSPSMTLLTNKDVPSPEQEAALVRYHNEYRRRCQDIVAASLLATHPALGRSAPRLSLLSTKAMPSSPAARLAGEPTPNTRHKCTPRPTDNGQQQASRYSRACKPNTMPKCGSGRPQ
jgi:hypothetical protein